MRQVLQELGSGRTILAEVPEPATPPGSLRILTRCSLISAGTERMLVDFGRAGWLERARQHPERVRQVIDKLRTDGVIATVEAVRGKLEQTLPLGYCNVGVVDASANCPGFVAGDRVVSNGPHAEVVTAAANLCARIPAEVSDEAAAFTVLAAIGLQGVRLAGPTLGESFVVTGLGLIGLLTVQLLRANGCRVLGIDPDPARTVLARRFGAVAVELGNTEELLAAVERFSHGRGVDGVLITAATDSDEPVSQAARMCRKRGRIVLVGVAGLKLNRADFYEKELTFQVSCSYGPGRYDPDYEQGSRDYPFGYVRWSAQRNFEAVLELMAAQRLDVLPLITHRFALGDAPRAYELLVGAGEPSLGVLLDYPVRGPGAPAVRTLQRQSSLAPPAGEPTVAVVGAGNYSARVLVPALSRCGVRLFGIASRGGVTAAQLGRKYGFCQVTTDAAALIANQQVNTVVVATRHDTHASFAQQALVAGKHVFVEKPLAITLPELEELAAAWGAAPAQGRPLLMVGFNRRFAPQVVRMKALLQAAPGPKAFVVSVNAGAAPADHWTQDRAVGGGRIIGEGCHFIDLLRFLAGVPIARWSLATAAAQDTAGGPDHPVTILLTFTDGSTGTVHYFPNGHRSFPKERVEVFCAGRILQLDNFRRLRGYGWSGFRAMNLWRQDKGHQACVAAFVAAIRTGADSPIPIDEVLEVSRVTIALGEAARR
jgi:predicted dehydrogenase/threonine dehydrogenase-like Zn-dependent dehydrogenase